MYSWDNAQVVLVGNKCDLESDRAVTQDRGQRLAEQLGKFLNRYCYLLIYIYLLDVRFSCSVIVFFWFGSLCLFCILLCFKGFCR